MTTHATARFWDRIANRYARKPVPNEAEYQTKLRKTAEVLKPTDRVLEVGCGTGSTALHHSSDVAHIRAIDVSPRMIDIARDKAVAAGVDNVTFDVADIASLSPDDQYDVIMAHSILHLVPDTPRALRQLQHLLKPGGLLIANTPCIGDIAPFFAWIGPIGRKLRLLPYIGVFKDRDYQLWIESAGFDIAEWWHPRPKASVYSIARKR